MSRPSLHVCISLLLFFGLGGGGGGHTYCPPGGTEEKLQELQAPHGALPLPRRQGATNRPTREAAAAHPAVPQSAAARRRTCLYKPEPPLVPLTVFFTAGSQAHAADFSQARPAGCPLSTGGITGRKTPGPCDDLAGL